MLLKISHAFVAFFLQHYNYTLATAFISQIITRLMVVENLTLKTLEAQRLICQHVRVCGGVLNVPISKELMSSCRSARMRYETFTC